MSGRGLLVRVPASSANLGPGFDSFAAALSMHLELEVRRTGRFAVQTELPVPAGRQNLCVRAFERVHDAGGFGFTIRSAIPLVGGLGSSAAATVAGLAAAAHMSGAEVDLLALAGEIEGHPDNVAAALRGGFVICADGQVTSLQPPGGLEVVAVVPTRPAIASGHRVSTATARAALPARVPLEQAVFNVAHGALLTLGLCRGDWELVARGLADRLHQPRRARLYPRSYELVREATGLGALGATVSGAGPTVLVWCRREQTAGVVKRLTALSDGWAQAVRVPFEPRGVQVREL